MVAQCDEKVLIQSFRVVGLLHGDHLVDIQPVQLQLQRVGDDAGLESVLIIGKGAGVSRQVVVDFHEPQRHEAVKPGVGHFLHGLTIAVSPDEAYERLTLLNLGRGQHRAVNVLGPLVDDFLLCDAVLLRSLGDAGDQLPPGPYRVFLNGILIHRSRRPPVITSDLQYRNRSSRSLALPECFPHRHRSPPHSEAASPGRQRNGIPA